MQSRIGGNAPDATVLHAVLVIVIRDDHDDGIGAIGGGSIVTPNRVLTAAHVVVDYSAVQVGFYVNAVLPANLRRVDPSFVQPMPGFDPATLENDICVLQFHGNPFPVGNVIPLTNLATPTGNAALASYGFTTPTDRRPRLPPLLAPHTIATECDEVLKATETHVCALATGPGFVCPGDNGSGLYTTGETPALVSSNLIHPLYMTRNKFKIVYLQLGVLSTMQEQCTSALQTAFTNIGNAAVRRFIESQSIPVDPLAQPPTPDTDAASRPYQIFRKPMSV